MPLDLGTKTYFPRCVAQLTFLDQLTQSMPFTIHTDYPAHPGVYPLDARWTRDSYDTPDTASLTIRAQDFPFHPQDVADLNVTIHMENVINPRVPIFPTPINCKFAGVADKIDTSRSDETVTIECRDYSSLFMATKLTAIQMPLLNSDLFMALVYICKSVTSLPTIQVSIPVDYNPGENMLWTKLPAGSCNPGVDRWPLKDGGTNAWEAISEIAGFCGYVVNVDFNATTGVPMLSIMSPRPLDKFNAPMFDFMGDMSNLETLNFSRDLNRSKNGVMVCSFSPMNGIGVPINGFYPPIVLKNNMIITTTGLPPGTQIPDVDPYEKYTISGYADPVSCSKAAQMIYDDKYAKDMTGHLTTRCMTAMSIQGEKSMFDLKYGSPINVSLTVAECAKIQAMGPGLATTYLEQRGYPGAVAAELVKLAMIRVSTGLQTFFVTTATHSFSNEEGYMCEADFANYTAIV